MQKRRHDIPQGFGFFAFERFMSNNAFSLEGIEKNIEQKCFTLYFIFSLCNKIFFLYKLQFILGAMLLVVLQSHSFLQSLLHFDFTFYIANEYLAYQQEGNKSQMQLLNPFSIFNLFLSCC